ncbi:MAG: metallophosphoesterase, partial [Aggregatilineales bacterium]
MNQTKVHDFDSGIAMVVTDLHGDGAVYEHLRDIFLDLHEKGEADRLIICGDLIHGYGDEADDKSLEMLLDVMRLQSEMGEDTIILLMGNHEMPHIYGITLSKGNLAFTPRFERALTRLDANADNDYNRADVIRFLKSLPFYVRTKAGVLLTHAGASDAIK